MSDERLEEELKLLGGLLFGFVATLLAGVAMALVAISRYSSEPTLAEQAALLELLI